ncbi:UNVERIFIED_CONTAM: hypothetical protein GTU68_012301 [Idotea baltica]|nr:hypothetical protein [Idotea baltica]
MVDMAVGIIVGGAFGKIITSLVNDVIMPPIGVMLGGAEAKGEVAAVTLNYGSFIQNLVDFLIVAFAIFMMVKVINSLKKKEEAAPSTPPKQEVLLEEIRDLLKK